MHQAAVVKGWVSQSGENVPLLLQGTLPVQQALSRFAIFVFFIHNFCNSIDIFRAFLSFAACQQVLTFDV